MRRTKAERPQPWSPNTKRSSKEITSWRQSPTSGFYTGSALRANDHVGQADGLPVQNVGPAASNAVVNGIFFRDAPLHCDTNNYMPRDAAMTFWTSITLQTPSLFTSPLVQGASPDRKSV